MAEPTLALSFKDLQTRVAEFLGASSYNASGEAQPPSGAHDLEVVKRIVNDGWRRFANSYPRWNWLAPTFQITFDANGTTDRTVSGGHLPDESSSVPRAARYYLPDGFYGVMLDWFTYAPSGPQISIENVTEGQIRDLYAANSSATGDPIFAAIRPIPQGQAGGTNNRRWEAIFYPTPDGSDVVTGRCRVYPNRMSADADRHAAGFQFDEAVLAACIAEADEQRNQGAQGRMALWREALLRAIHIDRQASPRNLGYNGDNSDGLPEGRGRYYNGVDTYTNANGTVTTF